MKRNVHTLQDALAFQLQGLYYAEKKMKAELEQCMHEITSEKLRNEMSRYAQAAENKLSKLERIFDYLMQEAEVRKNKAVVTLLEETKEMVNFTDSPHLKDILMVSCLQNINTYKISTLKVAYMFTVELEMDTASDLLQQILEAELETGKALSSLAIEEFNKGEELAGV
ncbi:MAG TPA: DUF892 family protein [Chryseosolibacter sp.]|nr:DUF892 family protein [Chryseosolibacter sp.]